MLQTLEANHRCRDATPSHVVSSQHTCCKRWARELQRKDRRAGRTNAITATKLVRQSTNSNWLCRKGGRSVLRSQSGGATRTNATSTAKPVHTDGPRQKFEGAIHMNGDTSSTNSSFLNIFLLKYELILLKFKYLSGGHCPT